MQSAFTICICIVEARLCYWKEKCRPIEKQPILLILSCQGAEVRKEDLIEFSYKEKTTCKMHAALIVYTTE